jgi:hypothetical protein
MVVMVDTVDLAVQMEINLVPIVAAVAETMVVAVVDQMIHQVVTVDLLDQVLLELFGALDAPSLQMQVILNG